jgi:ABC-type lipoprotein release transport system permease subunit
LPLFGVIVLAVLLISGIVAMMNSIPLSILTIYRYTEHYLGVTPRGDAAATPMLKERIEEGSPVPLDRISTVRVTDAELQSIVGAMQYAVLAMQRDDMEYMVKRMGGGEIEGRYPAPGEPEAFISEPVARNLNLEVGDTVLGPNSEIGFSPKEVQVVGIIENPYWLMMIPYEYHVENHFPPVDLLMAYAENLQDQKLLDRWAAEEFEGERVRYFAYFELLEEVDSTFKILYAILNVVIALLVVVITLMMGMLINIFQSQRVQEFGLLQALGYTKAALVKRLLGETALVVSISWVIGVGLAFGMLNYIKAAMFDPRAFALDPLDSEAYLYTLPVPLVIFLVAVVTVLLRLRQADPVGVIERRLI